MNWMVNDNAKIVNGYSGQQSWFMREFPRKLQNFPDDRSLAALAYISNLRYVVIISKFIPNFNSEEFKSRLARFKDDVQIVSEDSSGNLILAFDRKTLVDDNAIVITSPDHGMKNRLSFNIRGILIPNLASSNIRITDADTNEEIETIRVPHDGDFHEYEVNPAPTGEKVKMRRFKLQQIQDAQSDMGLSQQAKLFLRNPTFEVY